jgi:hypothetical protein
VALLGNRDAAVMMGCWVLIRYNQCPYRREIWRQRSKRSGRRRQRSKRSGRKPQRKDHPASRGEGCVGQLSSALRRIAANPACGHLASRTGEEPGLGSVTEAQVQQSTAGCPLRHLI